MKMPKKVQVAIDVMSALRNNPTGKPMKIANLAAQINTTEFFLQQVVRQLCKNNLVKSVRGPGGGILIGDNPDMSVLSICQAMGYFAADTTVSGNIEAVGYTRVVANKIKETLASLTL